MSAFKIIGVMTGNSLDAVDVVLTEFSESSIQDICGDSLDYPQALKSKLHKLRKLIKESASPINELSNTAFFIETVNDYTRLVAQAVNSLLRKNGYNTSEIAAIGFPGQTCGHFPPSIAGAQPPYTLQLGNPNLLADSTQIPVIYDFRSDDLMNGGEGAPLAPMHNYRLAGKLRQADVFPVAFCNGGNTGNISVVSQRKDGGDVVLGWDIGPFNHLADLIARDYYNVPFDKFGAYGKQGKIIADLLRKLFNEVAITNQGANFYLQQPPKSSDPLWYHLPDISEYDIADVLRTAEYLSAYSFFHSLQYIPEDVEMPEHFLVFGGGWKNPLIMEDFALLLTKEALVLPEHKDIFARIKKRFRKLPAISWSDKYGFSGYYMEARIFADLAYCKMNNIPFTTPETTGCVSPTVCGVWCHPQSEQQPLYNRAAPGWQKDSR